MTTRQEQYNAKQAKTKRLKAYDEILFGLGAIIICVSGGVDKEITNDEIEKIMGKVRTLQYNEYKK